MPIFKIPGQNLSFRVPEEGQVFADSTGSSIFKMVGGSIVNFGGGRTAATDLRLGDGSILKSGQFISDGDPRLTDLARPVSSNFRGRNFNIVSANSQFIKQFGINAFRDIPKFLLPDVQSGVEGIFGKLNQSSNSDVSFFKPLQVKPSGEIVTQTTSPTNPNAPVFTSNLTGERPSNAPKFGQPGALNPAEVGFGLPATSLLGGQRRPGGTQPRPGVEPNDPRERNIGERPLLSLSKTRLRQQPIPTPASDPSIVNFLNSIGQKSDFSSRAALAEQEGISGFSGTAEQNTTLLNILRDRFNQTGSPQPTAQPQVGTPSANQLTGQPNDFLTPEQRAGVATAQQSVQTLQGLQDKGFGGFDVSQLQGGDISQIPKFNLETSTTIPQTALVSDVSSGDVFSRIETLLGNLVDDRQSLIDAQARQRDIELQGLQTQVGIQGDPIPLPIIGGQLQALKEQVAFQLLPVQNEIATISAQLGVDKDLLATGISLAKMQQNQGQFDASLAQDKLEFGQKQGLAERKFVDQKQQDEIANVLASRKLDQGDEDEGTSRADVLIEVQDALTAILFGFDSPILDRTNPQPEELSRLRRDLRASFSSDLFLGNISLSDIDGVINTAFPLIHNENMVGAAGDEDVEPVQKIEVEPEAPLPGEVGSSAFSVLPDLSGGTNNPFADFFKGFNFNQ